MLKLFKFFKKSNNDINDVVPRRTNRIAPFERESFVDFLLGKGEHKLSHFLINKYYLSCAPLATAVDLLVENSASITPNVFDKSDNKFLTEHPVLDLINSPNSLQSYVQFYERLAGLFILHGEVFLISTGNATREPLELWVVSPQSVTVNQATDGFANTLVVSNHSDSETFYRHEVNGKFRFYNRKSETSSVNDREIYQIKNFNPFGCMVSLRGRSQLQSIYYEIEQWLKSSVHNLSVLTRGATPSGIFTTNDSLDALTEDQYQRLEQQLRNYWEGASNAGRVGFLSNGIEFKSLAQSNKDMDFVNLKEKIQKDIYNRLKIPLPLVTEKTMTLANMSTSQIMLYDNAIKPLLSRLFTELTNFLMYRYPSAENLMINVDEGKIGVLAPRRNEQAIQYKDTEATTINDRRKLINLPVLEFGADSVYGNISDTPIAGDDIDFTNDNENGA